MAQQEAHNDPRFVQGRDRLAQVVRLLVEQNDFSHTDLQTFYRYICPGDERTYLGRSQISTLRNAKLPKPGMQLFWALGQVNLRLAQLAGSDAPAVQALEPLGPLPSSLKRLRDEKPFYMSNPETGLPMDLGDLCKLFCSELKISDSAWEELPAVFDDQEAGRVSQRLAIWAQHWMIRKKLIPVEARERIMDAYGVTDPKRRDKVWQVILGLSRWSGPELGEERDALRFFIGELEDGKALSIRQFDRWAKGEELGE